MAKTYRAWEPEQRWWLLPAVQEFVPPGHLVHVQELVPAEIDLSAILAVYDKECGQPAYRPVMMTASTSLRRKEPMLIVRGVARTD